MSKIFIRLQYKQEMMDVQKLVRKLAGFLKESKMRCHDSGFGESSDNSDDEIQVGHLHTEVQELQALMEDIVKEHLKVNNTIIL